MDKTIIGPHWAHLYGWPDDASEDIIAEEAATHPCFQRTVLFFLVTHLCVPQCGNLKPIEYRGQVLLAFEVEEDKNARIGKKNCPKAEPPELIEYEFRLDLFQVNHL